MKEDLYIVANRYKEIEQMINALATDGRSITELFNSLNLSQEVARSFHYVRKERNKVIHEVVALADRNRFEQSCEQVVEALNGYVDSKIAKLEEEIASLRSLKHTFSSNAPAAPVRSISLGNLKDTFRSNASAAPVYSIPLDRVYPRDSYKPLSFPNLTVSDDVEFGLPKDNSIYGDSFWWPAEKLRVLYNLSIRQFELILNRFNIEYILDYDGTYLYNRNDFQAALDQLEK